MHLFSREVLNHLNPFYAVIYYMKYISYIKLVLMLLRVPRVISSVNKVTVTLKKNAASLTCAPITEKTSNTSTMGVGVEIIEN